MKEYMSSMSIMKEYVYEFYVDIHDRIWLSDQIIAMKLNRIQSWQLQPWIKMHVVQNCEVERNVRTITFMRTAVDWNHLDDMACMIADSLVELVHNFNHGQKRTTLPCVGYIYLQCVCQSPSWLGNPWNNYRYRPRIYCFVLSSLFLRIPVHSFMRLLLQSSLLVSDQMSTVCHASQRSSV